MSVGLSREGRQTTPPAPAIHRQKEKLIGCLLVSWDSLQLTCKTAVNFVTRCSAVSCLIAFCVGQDFRGTPLEEKERKKERIDISESMFQLPPSQTFINYCLCISVHQLDSGLTMTTERHVAKNQSTARQSVDSTDFGFCTQWVCDMWYAEFTFRHGFCPSHRDCSALAGETTVHILEYDFGKCRNNGNSSCLPLSYICYTDIEDWMQ